LNNKDYKRNWKNIGKKLPITKRLDFSIIFPFPENDTDCPKLSLNDSPNRLEPTWDHCPKRFMVYKK